MVEQNRLHTDDAMRWIISNFKRRLPFCLLNRVEEHE